MDVLGCARVALELRDALAASGLDGHLKTSGSKGLQLYVPLDGSRTYAEVKPAARAVAEAMEVRAPDRVTARMARAARPGRVLIDWQQNTPHKWMVCAYSVRAKARRPTVSTPLQWEEVEAAVGAGDPRRLVFELEDVLQRVQAFGDVWAPLHCTAPAAVEEKAPCQPAASTA